MQLRKMNTAIFPVKYSPQFYKDVVALPRELAQFGESHQSLHVCVLTHAIACALLLCNTQSTTAIRVPKLLNHAETHQLTQLCMFSNAKCRVAAGSQHAWAEP
jgi:hypothetical protein